MERLGDSWHSLMYLTQDTPPPGTPRALSVSERVTSVGCAACEQLRLENARLREENARLSAERFRADGSGVDETLPRGKRFGR